eukprot:Nk52_evm17s136 gene=Nk52_evmTU17s136
MPNKKLKEYIKNLFQYGFHKSCFNPRVKNNHMDNESPSSSSWSPLLRLRYYYHAKGGSTEKDHGASTSLIVNQRYRNGETGQRRWFPVGFYKAPLRFISFYILVSVKILFACYFISIVAWDISENYSNKKTYPTFLTSWGFLTEMVYFVLCSSLLVWRGFRGGAGLFHSHAIGSDTELERTVKTNNVENQAGEEEEQPGAMMNSHPGTLSEDNNGNVSQSDEVSIGMDKECGKEIQSSIVDLSILEHLVWVFFYLSCTISLTITIAFWALLYEGGGLSAQDFNLHVLNSIIMIVDTLLFSRIVFRMMHVYIPVLYGFVYLVFIILYWSWGSREGNDHVVYDIVNWGDGTGEAIAYSLTWAN